MKKIFTLLTLALISIGTAWGADAADAVSARQTFSDTRDACTWESFNISIAKGNTAGGDGLYFTAPSDKALSASGNIQFGSCAWIGYVQVPSATSKGTLKIISTTNNDTRKLYLESGSYVVCAKTGSSVEFTAADVVSFADGYYIKLSNTDKSDYKAKSITVTLTDEIYPATVAVDPVFSLNKSSITTAQTAQICVGSRTDLDGITFDGDVTYGTAGVVKVDEKGKVTPLAKGTTTINFNTEAVAGKYNASTDNSLTITVTEAITVFDAAGLTNAQIILSQANTETYDYITCNANNWTDRGWSSPYNGSFLDWKTDRKFTVNVKNVTAFELYISGPAGRTYTIKVGDGSAVEYTQTGTGSGFVSSGVIATGTTGEVTIELEGGGSTLYPVYVLVNPAETITPSKEYTTYVTTNALDFTGLGIKAYVATAASATAVTLAEVTTVPAGTPLVLEGTAGDVYNVPVIASATAPASNLLLAGDGVKEIGGDSNFDYILKDGKFYRAQAGTLAVGKAYLHLSAAPSSREFLEIDFNGDVTAIKNIKVGTEDNVYYDLQGRRVLYPTKGLYIVNGKKVIIK
jgi:hypothetical protein